MGDNTMSVKRQKIKPILLPSLFMMYNNPATHDKQLWDRRRITENRELKAERRIYLIIGRGLSIGNREPERQIQKVI